MKKFTAFLLSLFLTITTLGGVTDVVLAQEEGSVIKERIKAFYEMRERRMDLGKGQTGTVSKKLCITYYKVDYVEDEADPHIEMDDQFLLVGPNPVSGIWQVTPLNDDHEWQWGHYHAHPTIHPNLFNMVSVNVKPHQAGPSSVEVEKFHEYQMEVEWGDDDTKLCPTYVVFKFLRHEGGAMNLHPGHAGAGIAGGI